MLVVLAIAVAVPRLTRRLGNARLLIGRSAVMLIGIAWLSRVSVDTPYLTGIALPMVVVGIGQGLGLSILTNAAMAGVAPEHAGAAGGLVNVVHHLGGAVGLGILVTVFAAAGSGDHNARELPADRVSAALTGAAATLMLALLVALILRPRPSAQVGCPVPAAAA
jgi:sugar phosphate permease